MKKFIKRFLLVVVLLYIIICGVLFFYQEKFIFAPQKLESNFRFDFKQEFEEKFILTKDGVKLNGVLFRADSSKGLIFYLHGNAGCLDSWGRVAPTYTKLNYDVFILDYRGYGKSEGSIQGQQQIFDDVQTVYNELKKDYPEQKIIVVGYSLGTGLASKLTSDNHPRLLILQAPYYSLKDMMRQGFPIVPTFLLEYKFETNQYLRLCKMPIVIFHGNQDEVIDYESSVRLKAEVGSAVNLITLNGQGHNGMTDNPEYQLEIEKILGSLPSQQIF